MTRKITVFEGWSWFKLNNLGLTLGTNLKFYTSVAKGLKLKVRKFWGLIPTFVEVTGEELVGRVFLAPPSWIGLIFLLPVLSSIFCSRFFSLCKGLFFHRPFTKYLYITTFIDVLFSTYFSHVLLFQHGNIETNPRPTKEKRKYLSFCHWNVSNLMAHNLTKISHLEAHNAIYNNDSICISETFIDSSVTEGDKNI